MDRTYRSNCDFEPHCIENLNEMFYSICLAAELLREAEKLIDQKIHPQIIIAGWRKATQVARDALTAAAMDNR
jgi:chaperonin GroEL (HSP60 family)